jgi:cytochrome c oxidase subunit 2
VKVPNTITALLVGILLTLISLWYGQHNGLLPQRASIEAGQIDQLFNTMMAIVVGLFLLVQGALIYAAIAFRRKPGDDTDAVPVEGNVPLEVLWTAIPAVIVLWLSIYSLDVYQAVNSGGYVGPTHMAHAHQHHNETDTRVATPRTTDSSTATEVAFSTSTPNATEPEPLMVDVSGLQYAWIFTYPETQVVSGELHLPADRPVQLNISAKDVIHAFWVPEFRLKQDAIPGQDTRLSFTPNQVGTYPVICAELCGAYHGAMKTRVIVHSPSEYQEWMQSQVVASRQLPEAIAVQTTESQLLDAHGLPVHLHHEHSASSAPG